MLITTVPPPVSGLSLAYSLYVFTLQSSKTRLPSSIWEKESIVVNVPSLLINCNVTVVGSNVSCISSAMLSSAATCARASYGFHDLRHVISLNFPLKCISRFTNVDWIFYCLSATASFNPSEEVSFLLSIKFERIVILLESFGWGLRLKRKAKTFH